MPSSAPKLGLVASLLLGGLACGELPEDTPVPTPTWDAELAAWKAYGRSTIDVTGRVVGPDGSPLEGATVQLDAASTLTDAGGRWSLSGVPRRNALLVVDAQGHRRWVSGAHLTRPPSDDRVQLETAVLDVDAPHVARLLFTGDMALGRRYLDPDEVTPRDQLPPTRPDAVIRMDHAADDSVAVVSDVVPFFEAADLRVVNLETPVTDDPSTPHETKQWAFFTLPESIAALQALGVQLVSLGNNHVYDYLEQGVSDTLAHLRDAGIAHPGAGLDLDAAFQTDAVTARGTSYGFMSATSIAGVGRAEPLFVASETQAGAADLRDTARVSAAMSGLVDSGHVPIALLHAGNEYARFPNDYMRDRVSLVAQGGAALVVGHHPHRTQGFSRVDGVLWAHSLGNFAFDQDRLETLPGYLLQVDLDGADIVGVQLVPQLVDEYRARPAVGELADWILRDAGELSDRTLFAVVQQGGRGWLNEDEGTLSTTTRQVDVPLLRDAEGRAYADLRTVREPGEVASRVDVPGGAERLWLGTDLMHFGGFEDVDVDADLLEASRWFTTEARPCLWAAWRGAAGMCLLRTHANTSDAVVAFRNRIRVLGDASNSPDKDLTLLARVKASNAGALELYVRWQASFGDKVFGDETAWVAPGGTFDWTPIVAPLHLPADVDDAVDPWADNARAVRPFLSQSPPAEGEGLVGMDDVAVVTWHEGPFDGGAVPLTVPNSGDFVRVDGADGDHLTVTLLRSVPSVAVD